MIIRISKNEIVTPTRIEYKDDDHLYVYHMVGKKEAYHDMFISNGGTVLLYTDLLFELDKGKTYIDLHTMYNEQLFKVTEAKRASEALEEEK